MTSHDFWPGINYYLNISNMMIVFLIVESTLVVMNLMS